MRLLKECVTKGNVRVIVLLDRGFVVLLSRLVTEKTGFVLINCEKTEWKVLLNLTHKHNFCL